MIKLFLKSLKHGLVLAFFLIFFLIVYTIWINLWLAKSVGQFKVPLKLGTVVSSDRLFNKLIPSMELRHSWQNIQNKFNYFVIEYQLRDDFIQHQSPRLMNWCKENECVAHRIKFLDNRTNQFKLFTLDDFFSNTRLNLRRTEYQDFRLKAFLQSLPVGSTVIISEPFSLFDRPQVFHKFREWVLKLRAEHPELQ
ncbi:hypothetical protein QUB11_31020, partial [Microcoleus sp. B6-A1]|uniref:hypothetical protein n=1 Tax=Microcoleus sp. B6-A1 TaxID=2818684 RepID=UPI002FD7918B